MRVDRRSTSRLPAALWAARRAGARLGRREQKVATPEPTTPTLLLQPRRPLASYHICTGAFGAAHNCFRDPIPPRLWSSRACTFSRHALALFATGGCNLPPQRAGSGGGPGRLPHHAEERVPKLGNKPLAQALAGQGWARRPPRGRAPRKRARLAAGAGLEWTCGRAQAQGGTEGGAKGAAKGAERTAASGAAAASGASAAAEAWGGRA